MQGLLSILSLSHNELNNFNNTGARMLDSIYHMTLKLFKSRFLMENVKILPKLPNSGNFLSVEMGSLDFAILYATYDIMCPCMF